MLGIRLEWGVAPFSGSRAEVARDPDAMVKMTMENAQALTPFVNS
jgi:hypothetical protein